LNFGSTSPVSITSATAATATLTISTTAPTTSMLVYPKRLGVPWLPASGVAFAGFLFFGIPARRRKWRSMLGMLALLSTFAGGAIACGGSGGSSGGGGGGGGGGGIAGTTAGTYTVTVTGTSGNTTGVGTFNLTVQ
jgi:hypothetical protein